ncbi:MULTISPECIES: hypothetical protein [Hyphobacterium]|uniref:Tetratricopeptide repeat protein n=1 Tax=Hyphobacterium vulgare TaxID=1736751 RepID=A0ABV7A0B8_9PROT
MARRADTTALVGALAALTFAGSVLAAEPVEFRVETIGNTARLVITYPETFGGEAPTAEIESAAGGTVLIARFSEPVEGSTDTLAAALGDRVAMVRLDPDGSALRLAMRGAQEARVTRSWNMVAIDLVPPGGSPPPRIISPHEQAEIDAAAAAAAAPPPPPPPALPVALRFGTAASNTRIEFLWPEEIGYSLEQDGNTISVHFEAPGEMDLAELRASPPRLLQMISAARGDTDHALELLVDDGVTARIWNEEGRIVLDLLDPDRTEAADLLNALAGMGEVSGSLDDPDAVAEPEQHADAGDHVPGPDEAATEHVAPVQHHEDPELPPETEREAPEHLAVEHDEPRADPVPPGGVVHVAATEANGDLLARFEWAAPVGLSVFRRGEAIWAVFDADATLDMGEVAQGARGHIVGFELVDGDGYTAVRMVAPTSTNAEVRFDGAYWTLAFSERIETPPTPVVVDRQTAPGAPSGVVLRVAHPTAIHWVDDPIVGDRIAVVTALAPIEGLLAPRVFPGGSLLASTQGAAAETYADDLLAQIGENGVRFARPDAASGQQRAVTTLAMTATARHSPAFMDFEAWRGSGNYWRDLTRRQNAASQEDANARVDLARFYLANGLAPEALGALDAALQIRPQLADDPHVHALAGVASYMMGRIEDAHTAFAIPVLMSDPDAAPWRAMIAADQEEWEEASRRFDAGNESIYGYTPEWRARFRVARARVALENNDFAAASAYLRDLSRDEPGPHDLAEAEWIAARIDAESGEEDRAIERFRALSRSGYPGVEAAALLELYRLELANGEMTAEEGVEALENLRLRWRGDALELDTIRLLGHIYIREGAYAQGLETMRTAQARFPDSRASRRIGSEMAEVFRALFLEGEADNLDPIEAVALFYEYRFLTPIGSDGDRMVRRLVDRLVAFDLLGQAADLLEYQVENRLREPQARAQVATDLTVIYLTDHRPADALRTLRNTRVAGLPEDLVAERRMLEARAHAELGRFEHALELVAGDESATARRLRADVAWDRRDWPDAGRRLESALGTRWQDDTPLGESEQADVLRTAIAFNLAGDRDSIRRLDQRYGALMRATAQATSFDVLTSELTVTGDARVGDLARRIADIDTLDAFMQRYQTRFETGGES